MNRIPAVVAVIVDEIGRGQDITASASTSDRSRKRRSVQKLMVLVLLLLLLLIAAAPVVTLPFIKRQVVLGLVEGVLQLGDAPPSITRRRLERTSDDLDRTGGL